MVSKVGLVDVDAGCLMAAAEVASVIDSTLDHLQGVLIYIWMLTNLFTPARIEYYTRT